MHHFGCGMNWITGYYMIVEVKNETFWFSTFLMEMHSLTSSSLITCLWGETFGSRTRFFEYYGQTKAVLVKKSSSCSLFWSSLFSIRALSAPYKSYIPNPDFIIWKYLIYLWFPHNLFKILSFEWKFLWFLSHYWNQQFLDIVLNYFGWLLWVLGGLKGEKNEKYRFK